MNESIFKLMAFYLLHRNWRARISANNAASWIWTLWLLGAMQGAFAAFAAATGKGEAAAILAAGAAFGFGVSGLFVPAAKRKHVSLQRVGNPVLFCDGSEKV
jgi:hypothetical protein